MNLPSCQEKKECECLDHSSCKCVCHPTNPERSEGKDTIENGLEVEAVPTPNGGSFTFTPPKERRECAVEDCDGVPEWGHAMCMKHSPCCSSLEGVEIPELPAPSRAEGCGYGVAEARIDRNLNSFRALPLTPEIRDEDILELRRWMLADVIELLLSSRQSSIEECVKAVEEAVKRKGGEKCLKGCEPTCRHQWREIGYDDARFEALTTLSRLLREESEDKKDGV